MDPITIGAIVNKVVPGVTNVIEKHYEDKTKAKEVISEVQQGLYTVINTINANQAAIQIEEAKHPHLFVAGWRPFVGWGLGSTIWYFFLTYPLNWVVEVLSYTNGWESFPRMEVPEMEIVISLLSAMLGIAGFRSFEKIKNVARSNLGFSSMDPNIDPLDPNQGIIQKKKGFFKRMFTRK